MKNLEGNIVTVAIKKQVISVAWKGGEGIVDNKIYT